MSEDAGLEGSQVVTNWFGYRPSLHDAEILSVDFQRAIDNSGPGLVLFGPRRSGQDAGRASGESTSQCWVQSEPASVAALRCRQLRVQNLHAFNHWRTGQKLGSLLHQRLGDRP